MPTPNPSRRDETKETTTRPANLPAREKPKGDVDKRRADGEQETRSAS